MGIYRGTVNVCTPSIPAGLKCPAPSKTISLITCIGAYLNNRNVENEGDSDGKRKNRREEIVGSVYFDPVYLENSKKQRGKRKALGAKIESVERVYPLYRVSSEVFVVNIFELLLGGPL